MQLPCTYRPYLRYVTDPPAGGSTSEPTNPPAPAAPTAAATQRLPDDHPLVTAYERQKAENAALRDKAKAFDDLEEAKKTDAQKAADRITALESENAGLKADALKSRVAAAKGVPVELLTGTTEAELNAAADKLLAFKGPGGQLPGNNRPAGPIPSGQEHEESREDRRKRLAEGLRR